MRGGMVSVFRAHGFLGRVSWLKIKLKQKLPLTPAQLANEIVARMPEKNLLVA